MKCGIRRIIFKLYDPDLILNFDGCYSYALNRLFKLN